MKSFASFVLSLSLSLAACGDDTSGGSCPGSPSGGCEQVVESQDECPSLQSVCQGVCGASYDCCYCDPSSGAWATLYLDCPVCSDAGVDAP